MPEDLAALLTELVYERPGLEAVRLLDLLRGRGHRVARLKELNRALYRNPEIGWLPGEGTKRLWYPIVAGESTDTEDGSGDPDIRGVLPRSPEIGQRPQRLVRLHPRCKCFQTRLAVLPGLRRQSAVVFRYGIRSIADLLDGDRDRLASVVGPEVVASLLRTTRRSLLSDCPVVTITTDSLGQSEFERYRLQDHVEYALAPPAPEDLEDWDGWDWTTWWDELHGMPVSLQSPSVRTRSELMTLVERQWWYAE